LESFLLKEGSDIDILTEIGREFQSTGPDTTIQRPRTNVRNKTLSNSD